MAALEQYIADLIQARFDDDRDYRYELVAADLADDNRLYITVRFTDKQLIHEIQGDLWAAGNPIVDWDNPDAPMGEGSPTYEYAVRTAEFFNGYYLGRELLARHEDAIQFIVHEHTDRRVRVEPRPYYTAELLMPAYKQLKARHAEIQAHKRNGWR